MTDRSVQELEVFPAAPVCRWRVELEVDAGGVAIRSWQGAIEPANTPLSDGTEDARLVCSLEEVPVGRKIGSVHSVDGSEGAGLEAMNTGGEGLA